MIATNQSTVPQTGFATMQEAQDFLRVGKNTLYKMIRANEVPSTKFCDTRRIPWPALHQMVKDACKTTSDN